MYLDELYYILINEIQEHLKYTNEEEIDFEFTPETKKFKFYIPDKENIRKTKSTNKKIEMEKIKLEIINCKKCKLQKTRTNTVPGSGNLNAEIMFIGEGPGEQEDLSGKPFVGKAGQLLEKIINNVMHLKREDVYMTNIVKCRPPGNRNPDNHEVSSCIGYLYSQIKTVNPKIIVLLGSVALGSLLPAYKGIIKNRGRILKLYLSKEHIYTVIPTYHPSYLLRGTPDEIKRKKYDVWQDIKKVMKLLDS